MTTTTNTTMKTKPGSKVGATFFCSTQLLPSRTCPPTKIWLLLTPGRKPAAECRYSQSYGDRRQGTNLLLFTMSNCELFSSGHARSPINGGSVWINCYQLLGRFTTPFEWQLLLVKSAWRREMLRHLMLYWPVGECSRDGLRSWRENGKKEGNIQCVEFDRFTAMTLRSPFGLYRPLATASQLSRTSSRGAVI